MIPFGAAADRVLFMRGLLNKWVGLGDSYFSPVARYDPLRQKRTPRPLHYETLNPLRN